MKRAGEYKMNLGILKELSKTAKPDELAKLVKIT